MPVVSRLVIAMGLCLCAAVAHAQSLGEVARRTGADRKASGTPVTKLTDKDLPAVSRLEAELRDFQLSYDEFSHYADAKEWVLDRRIMYPKIDAWLAKAERDGVDPSVIETMIQQEPLLSDMLDWNKILPHAYILTDVAFNRALADAMRTDDELSRMPPARAANARFVRDNPRNTVQAALYRWGEKQKRLEERRRYR